MDLREITLTETNRHPWELARFQFFSRVFEECFSGMKELDVLDVGSGDAWLAQQLLQKHPTAIRSMTCWDAHYTPEMARTIERNSRIRAVSQPPKEARFHCVLLLDCLEHVEDDSLFLSSIVENHLLLGGQVIVSVPAWQSLFSNHDRLLLHFRRYSPTQGRRVIEKAGLTLLRSGGLFHSLLLPRAVGVWMEKLRKKPPSGEIQSQWRGGPTLTQTIEAALRLDGAASRIWAKLGIEIPGLSWWAVCKKSS